jgi:hypothetical protein
MSVVALNALFLQRVWSSWWTGKIGDAAWMVVAPFLAAAVIVWWLPAAWAGNPRLTGGIAILLTGLGFTLTKAVPMVNGWALETSSAIGLPLKLRLDPTDLMVLPVLWIAWLIWMRGPVPRPDWIRWPSLGLAALIIMADMAPPASALDCLLLKDGQSVVFHSPANHAIYSSADGGLTWIRDDSTGDEYFTNHCAFPRWPVESPGDDLLVFQHIAGRGLYISNDGGATFKLERVVDPVTVIGTSQRSLILSEGNGELWVRTADGEWLAYHEIYPDLRLERVTE